MQSKSASLNIQNKIKIINLSPCNLNIEYNNNIQSLNDKITGAVSSKPAPVYTGTKFLGIGTMHKSNAVHIFSDNEAKEISTMRR
jgi:hypothetical protein